jgi:hypothetical protein
MLAATAFNLARGFSTLSGAYSFFLWLLTCGLGVTFKMFYNEPADSNLISPVLDMGTYVGIMLSMVIVIFFLKRLDLRKHAFAVSYFANYGKIDYDLASKGFLMVGVLVYLLNLFVSSAPGTIISALNYANIFFPLGGILATIFVIRSSAGRHTFNAVSVLCMLQVFFFGFIGFSKQGLLTPAASWLIAAAYCRLRLRPSHYLFILANVLLAIFFVTPWSNGRTAVPESGLDLSGRVQLAIFELQHFNDLKTVDNDFASNNRDLGISGYFNAGYGLLDRLSIISADDQLISFSAAGHYDGYYPVIMGYENWIPHFLDPNKPSVPTGNFYSHEMGTISDDDTTTGISYSPAAEAFHLGGWMGIFLMFPSVMFLLFITIDLTAGDLRVTPWGLFFVLAFSHIAPEGGVSSPINMTFYANVGMIAAIFFGTRVAPIIGAVLKIKTSSTISAQGALSLPRPKVT